MTNSEQPPIKCFSAILRRLLCSGSLPTHPSSDPEFTTSTSSTHIPEKTEPRKTDDSTATELLQPQPSTTTTTPAGVVARLMGLDSFPNSPQTTRTSLGTILRSRSVNSVDFLPSFEPSKQAPHHRLVRTSVSFREVPTFLQTQQNHDVFLVCFDKVQEFGKTDMDLALKDEKSKKLDQKNKKGRLNVDLKMNMKKKSQNQNLKGKSEEVNSATTKCRRKRKERKMKKGEDEVAVARQRKYKSKCQTYNHPLPKIVKKGRDDDQKQSKKGKKKSELKRRERERGEYGDEYCVKVLMEVCRLTEKETQGCVWMDRKAVNNFQETGYELSHEILQVLLYEVVDDLRGCSKD